MKLSNIISKHAPSIAIYAGAISLLGTSALTYRMAQKDELTVKDYILPSATAALGLAGIIFGERSFSNEVTNLRVACDVLTDKANAFRKVAKDIAETAGLGAAAVTAKVAENSKNSTIFSKCKSEDGETLHWFYDEFTDIWFKSTWANLLNANIHLQDRYQTLGEVSVYEYYSNLGDDFPIEQIKSYEDRGWNCDYLINECECTVGVPFEYGDLNNDFGDGLTAIGVWFPILPKLLYYEW